MEDSPEGASGTWTLPTPADFRLAPTVCSHGGFRYPPFRWDRDTGTLTRVLSDDGGEPLTVEVREVVVERVEIRHGGADAVPEEIRTTGLRIGTPGVDPDEDRRVRVDEAVVQMLELARDLHDFHELCRDDPALKRIPEMGAGRLLRCPTLWEELAKAVCTAAVDPGDAVDAVAAVAALGPGPPGRRAWPSPARVLDASADALEREAGLGAGAGHLTTLARRFRDGSLDAGAAEAGLLDAGALEALVGSVDGLDGATRDRLLVLLGDSGRLPRDPATLAFVRDRHFGGRTPAPEEIRERYGRFGRWKGLALWFEVVQATLWPEVGLGP